MRCAYNISSMGSPTNKRSFQNIWIYIFSKCTSRSYIKCIRKRIKDEHFGFAVICYLVIVKSGGSILPVSTTNTYHVVFVGLCLVHWWDNFFFFSSLWLFSETLQVHLWCTSATARLQPTLRELHAFATILNASTERLANPVCSQQWWNCSVVYRSYCACVVTP